MQHASSPEHNSQASEKDIHQILSDDEESLQPEGDEEPEGDDHSGAGAEEDIQEKEHHNENISPHESENESEDGESSSDDSEEEEETKEKEPVMVGGEIDTPAFALLAGMEDADDISEEKTVSIPLTRLPAILGRTHETKDQHFFGMGTRKALSRQQFVIYYQNAIGGRLGQFEDNSEEMIYRRPPPKYKENVTRLNKDKPLPPNGFFVVECVGKNSISVGGQRVKQGELALLEHGTTLRVNAFSLYFLLPTNATATKTIEVPKNNGAEGNKRKAPSAAPAKPAKRVAKGSAGVVAELEALPVETLLARMSEAVESNQWERKHQMIGSAISLHAVKQAARAKSIRSLAKKDAGNGVARSDIMAWIRENPTYTSWVDQMLGKMELKSYQSNVSKALIKAGYVRTGTTGRHVKWILPEVESDEKEEIDEEEESDEGSQDDASDVEDDAGNNCDHSKEESDTKSHGEELENEEDKGDKKHESSGSSSGSDSDENSVRI